MPKRPHRLVVFCHAETFVECWLNVVLASMCFYCKCCTAELLIKAPASPSFSNLARVGLSVY